jgi:eukaryotic-like serine/threonine-protein kinase
MPVCPTCRTHYADSVSVCEKDGDTLLPEEAFTGVDADLAAGEIVGEYRIEGKLGEGGFGAVYRAVHPLIGKAAAIKVLNRQYSSNPQMVSRFISEARAVNQIRNRNIIDIFSFGALADGRQYYVMELLDGTPFDAYLKKQGRLEPARALPLLRSIARTLEAAHAKGIAHRDLKPENVFLVFDEEGMMQPKLLDFGIAKLLTDPSGGHKTRTGTPMGTPNYMSPEQCRGQNVDHRTDIYSFGVLCHQVLTGSLPFDGEAVMDILVKHMTAAPPRMSAVCPELPGEMDAPVQRMLAKEPSDRPQSIAAAVDELVSAAAQSGTDVQKTVYFSARPQPMPPGTPRQLTPAEMALAQARTVLPDSNKTFLPAETDVGQRPRKKTWVWLVAGAGAVAAAAILVFTLHGQGETAKTLTDRNQGASQTAPTSPPSTPPVISAPPMASLPPVESPPSEVLVTVESTPAGASVFRGTKKLGAAPGPIHLPYAANKVTLTVKADGYQPKDVDVLPTSNVVLSVALVKNAAAGPTHTTPHDLENPF